jgi:transcriptional regulator with XRE-family HTH domain
MMAIGKHPMPKTTDDQRFSAFKNRLIEILNQETQVWWADRIGISQSVISNSYYKGSFPRTDKLMKIIQLSGVSANWLLFGKGAKYLDDMDEHAIDRRQDRKREQQIRILEIEAENQDLKERIKALQRQLEQQKVDSTIGMSDQIKGSSGHDIFEQNVFPVMTMFRLLNEIALKIVEIHTKERMDSDQFIHLTKWIRSNFETKKFETITKLSELQSILKPTTEE